MLEIALHAGAEHPNLIWILLAAGGSFIAGIGIGHYAGRLRAALPFGPSAD